MYKIRGGEPGLFAGRFALETGILQFLSPIWTSSVKPVHSFTFKVARLVMLFNTISSVLALAALSQAFVIPHSGGHGHDVLITKKPNSSIVEERAELGKVWCGCGTKVPAPLMDAATRDLKKAASSEFPFLLTRKTGILEKTGTAI